MATTFLEVKNRAVSTLASAITDSDLSLDVAAGALFPSSYPFHITIDAEILSCTNRAADTLTVVRAQQGTVAAAHLAAVAVALNITAKSVSDLNAAVNTAEADIVTLQAAPPAHAPSHENGGGDEIGVAGLSGLLADDQHVLDAEALAAAVQAGAITNAVTKAPTHDAVYDVKVTADAAQTASEVDADITTHAGIATAHHTKFTNAEAITAVEGEPTLVLGGNVTLQGLDLDLLVAGDILYGSAADTLQRLPKGSNNEVLTLAGGVPSWGAAGAPGAHAASHQDGGGDEISVTALSGLLADDQHVLDAEVVTAAKTVKLDDFAIPDDNTDLDASGAKHGLMPKADASKLGGIAAGADVTGSNTPQAHNASHQNAGGDEISVAGLSGVLADDQHVLDSEVTNVAIAKSLLTTRGDIIFRNATVPARLAKGPSGYVLTMGANDPAWVAAAAPGAHAASHQNGGGDEISVTGLSGLLADDQHVLDAEVKAIKLDDFATPDDNTDLNFGTTRHGLTPKGTNVGDFLRDDGTWATPANGSTTFDAVVAASGGDFTSIQAADDALDATTTGYTMYVKGQQTYTEDVTISTDGAYIFIEPGTTLVGAWLITGSKVVIEFGAGCILTGTLITNTGTGNKFLFGPNSTVSGVITLTTADNRVELSAGSSMSGLVTLGIDCSLICENGVALVGILASGAGGYVNGGGHGTISNGGTARDGVVVDAADVVIENIAGLTTAGQGNALVPFISTSSGVRAQFINVLSINSDQGGFHTFGASTQVVNSKIFNSDGPGISVNAFTNRIIGNEILNSTGEGIQVAFTGDGCLIVGNNVKDQTTDSIVLHANAEDCLAVGNKLDGAVNDLSGTSTVVGNEVTAF